MLRRIAVLNRSFHLLHGNKSLAELQDLLQTEYICRVHDLLSFGWVQYEGPLDLGTSSKGNSDNLCESRCCIWLGVSWDRENKEKRGTRTSGRLQEGGPELFQAITEDVSFVRSESLPEWSVRGVSFFQAVIDRYSEWTSSLSLDEVVQTKLQIVGLPSHIVCRAWDNQEQSLHTAKWRISSVNLTENLLLWRWIDIWEILSVLKSVDKLVLSKCSYLFHPLSRTDDFKRVSNGSINEGFDLSELVLADIKNHFQHNTTAVIAKLIHKFLLNFRNLNVLDLSLNNHIDNEAISLILQADLPSIKTIKCLRLNNTNIHQCLPLFALLNIIAPQCKEVSLSNTPLDWNDGDSVDQPQPQSLQITSLNLNYSNIYNWRTFLLICTVFPNLRTLRLRHNPFIEGTEAERVEPNKGSNGTSGPNMWVLQRYLRFSLLPDLEWADGEQIDTKIRREAELYIINLISNVERSVLLPAEIRKLVYSQDNLLYPLLKLLCSRHEQDWDRILAMVQDDLERQERVERRARNTADIIARTLGIEIGPTPKSKILEIIRNSSAAVGGGGLIKLQIECRFRKHSDSEGNGERNCFECFVFPDITTVWRIKQEVSRRMKDPAVINMKAFWIVNDSPSLHLGYHDVLRSMPELHDLGIKYGIKNKMRGSSILLTPAHGFIDYFGMTNTDKDQPETFKILLTH